MVPLGGPKQRATLGLLVCELGRVVPVDALIEGLRGDEPTPGARSTLQTYVSNLPGDTRRHHRPRGWRLSPASRPALGGCRPVRRRRGACDRIDGRQSSRSRSAAEGCSRPVARSTLRRRKRIVPTRVGGPASGGVAACRGRGADRSRASYGTTCRTRRRAERAQRGVPPTRGLLCSEHAGALSVGPAGRGTPCVSEDPQLSRRGTGPRRFDEASGARAQDPQP